MKNSDIIKLFARANKRCGHDEYAEILDNTAAVYEANEIVRESEKRSENERA